MWVVAFHLDVLGCARLHKHTGTVLYAPSDDDLLGNAAALLANLPDNGVLNGSHSSVRLFRKQSYQSHKQETDMRTNKAQDTKHLADKLQNVAGISALFSCKPPHTAQHPWDECTVMQHAKACNVSLV